jgi:hypothetical protein
MTAAPFVPLALPAPRATASPDANGFQALVPTSAPPAASPARPACEPKLTLERDGDRILLIRIQCGCGEVIEVGCAY